jgi:pilus assembly protein CpaF
MINIVISEKGGAERREVYSQAEVSIGRVKGNDVLLPKGNVSKRHARLIMRDGRYIVTDLKSTNGTYVNHRRITHATLVREGDRIYIGDFVLRIAEGEESAAEDGDAAPSTSLGATPPKGRPVSGMPPSGGTVESDGSQRPSDVSQATPRGQVISHFPIEDDPDEASPLPDMPGPPRMPGGFRPQSTGKMPAVDAPYTLDAPATSGPSSPVLSSESTGATPVRSSQPSGERRQQERLQEPLEMLTRELEGSVDDALLAANDPSEEQRSAVREAAEAAIAKLRDDGMLGGEADEPLLLEALQRELTSTGPLEGLLDDEATTEIRVLARQVAVHRRGRRARYDGLGFGSDAAVERAVRRMCKKHGHDLSPSEAMVEVELEPGLQLFFVRSSAGGGPMLVLRRPQRVASTLNSLVRGGTIARGMATLLSYSVAARGNILIAGAPDSGLGELLHALAHAVPKSQRALWLSSPGEALLPPEGAAVLELGEDDDAAQRTIAAAAKLGPDHLVVPPVSADTLLRLLDASAKGAHGMIMLAHATTMMQAWTRTAAELAGCRTGLTPDVAREWIASSFDLGVEVTRLRDGRMRVSRLSEFRSGSQGSQLREIFTFAYHRTATGGSIEGSFHAAGNVPRIVDDLAARGMPLDTSIFRRHPSG